MPENVLVTGGAGYIGSSICSALADAGHIPIVVDTLSTGHRGFVGRRRFYEGDAGDSALIARVFRENAPVRFAIHCAASTSVPESVRQPYAYYKNNVAASIELFGALARLGCRNVVFSGSASVYAADSGAQATELSPVAPASPYARSKLMCERVLEDIAAAEGMRALSLRYFNPIGADPKMRSGQAQKEAAQVLSALLEVAAGRQDAFSVTGVDWNTRDGTGIRDYIHVWDIARAHVAAVERMESAMPPGGGFEVVNLGSGRGVTVRELVAAFERALGSPVPTVDAPPRPGDVAGAFCSAEKAERLLEWRAEMRLEDGIRHALEWARERESRDL